MKCHILLVVAMAELVAGETDTPELRKIQVPYVADAVGNTIPPPANGPSKVGSPSSLLTPDRYEFYTFDDSGELVKRLMTLDEIQAIVAAGDGNDGHMVTFANDEPTISFNFSQPSHNKVHSVVTNVQNVLKEQMEAQKNKPPRNGPFDTPDVSDSWSLILPSIFGNTGVDIVPDKPASSFGTPDTDTIDVFTKTTSDPFKTNTFFSSKEETGSEIEKTDNLIKEFMNRPTSSHQPYISSTTTMKSSAATNPIFRSTTNIPSTSKNTISQISATTKEPVRKTTIEENILQFTTTPNTSTKPVTLSISTHKETMENVDKTTKKPSELETSRNPIKIVTSRPSSPKPFSKPPAKVQVKATTITNAPDKPSTISTIEKRSTTMTPSSTQSTTLAQQQPSSQKEEKTSLITTTTVYSTTKTYGGDTKKPVQTTVAPKSSLPPNISSSLSPEILPLDQHSRISSTTTYKPVDVSVELNKPSQTNSLQSNKNEIQKHNETTTITTQSVSPSTAASTTEMISEKNKTELSKEHLISNSNDDTLFIDINPIFDVAQSFNQIASDLGNEIPNIEETTPLTVEQKDNGDIDITETTTSTQNSEAFTSEPNYVKVSTFDPNDLQSNTEKSSVKTTTIEVLGNTNPDDEITIKPQLEEGPVDKVLVNSMTDLISQVANLLPHAIVKTTIRMDENVPTTQEYIFDKTTPQPDVGNVTSTDIKTYENTESSTYTREPTHTTVISPNNNTEQTTVSSNERIETKATVNISKNEMTTSASESTYEYIRLSTVTPALLTTKTELPFTNTPFHYHKSTTIRSINTKEPIQLSNKTTTINKLNGIEDSNSKKETFIDNVALENFSKDNENRTNSSFVPVLGTSTVKSTKVEDLKKKIQKVNIDDKELTEQNSTWKLISTVIPPTEDQKQSNELFNSPDKEIILDSSKENQGLEATIKDLNEDIRQFTELCNELAFKYWQTTAANTDKKRSLVLSPYAITSMLAMMFMGARGGTSGEMNEVLKLDDMVTFNPHFTLKNISDSIEVSPESGVAASAFVRELFSDRNNGKILTFYKERAQHFYNGLVEEVNFKIISDIIRRRTNLLVKRYTWGKIPEYIKSNSISMTTPLAALSVNIFQTDCSTSSVEGRDGEMYFVVSPSVRQRRLVPVPAVVYKKGFLAGYDPNLDATAASIGTTNSTVSVIFLMPGQQGNTYHAEDLEALEKRLLESSPATPAWNRLLRTLLPRSGLEIQIPRFSHKSIFNISSTLRIMGLHELFDASKADLGGLNGPSKNLHLSDMIQLSNFVTCGESLIGEQHHIEEYPDTIDTTRRRRTSRWSDVWDEPRDYQRAFHDPHDIGAALQLPLHLRPRQARLPSRSSQPARLKFDRPFLFLVRHNPTSMILYVGRYNPRLLP